MPAYNSVVMVGNLTNDPQLSYTPNQTAVIDSGIAVDRKWTGSDGSAKEETCFLDVRAFGRLAENINKYLHKGSLLLVQGYLAYEKWTAKDGGVHSKHRLIAQSVQFLDGHNIKREASELEPQPDEDIPF